MLTEWGVDKFNLWMDLNQFYLYLGNEFIMSIWVDSNGILQFEFGEEWEDYLLEGTLKDIQKEAQEMIDTSKTKGKGKGKSKEGGTKGKKGKGKKGKNQ